MVGRVTMLRIDQFALFQHWDVVQIEKVQRPDGLQSAYFGSLRFTVPSKKRSKVLLPKKCDPSWPSHQLRSTAVGFATGKSIKDAE
jgi:hypothetical protein